MSLLLSEVRHMQGENLKEINRLKELDVCRMIILKCESYAYWTVHHLDI